MSYRSDAQDSGQFRALVPTVPQMVLRAAQARAGAAAIIHRATGRRITYRQLINETRHAAKACAPRGLQKGDVVCLASPNLPEYAIAVLAVAMAGGVVTLLAPNAAPEQWVSQLQTTGAKFLLTTRAYLRAGLLAASQTDVRHVYSFDAAPGALHFAELFETVMADDERPTEALLDPQRDLMAWLFAPREEGVRHTHAEIVAALQQPSANESATVDLSAVSFAQEGALLTLLRALWRGATVTI